MCLENKLIAIAGANNILKNEPMYKHTTYKIGGPADYFVTPVDAAALKETIVFCRKKGLPFYIIGNGSNLLVGDGGFRGVVIQIFNHFGEVKAKGTSMDIRAGALLSKVANIALREELQGFEFASGIPGTFGGAVVMNAGAYGGEMKDILKSVEILDDTGQIKTLSAEVLELGYRSSIFARKPYVILGGTIQLKKGNKEAILDLMEDLKMQRTTKQPLEFPSAGSTFKRPKGYFVGKLVADSGLRGFQVGDAQVSEKHCGFVINKGQATAADVVSLMDHVIEKIEKDYQVRLEPEVKRIGEFIFR
ncbi:MAG: UDP-N-acetylmuramate dehydrogenase [Lachnospiraceae bacterium]|nr:UDP-N-acetylmuramate dehydrogenase [Lachnospiraceae bacterium]